jgi:hypothetical protein
MLGRIISRKSSSKLESPKAGECLAHSGAKRGQDVCGRVNGTAGSNRRSPKSNGDQIV